MSEHRIYYLGENGRIVGVDDSALLEEPEALARARALAAEHHGIEIWRGAERVARINRSDESDAR